MSAEITYDADGYAETPEGQAWKLWVFGGEPVSQADRAWFGSFNAGLMASTYQSHRSRQKKS